MSKRRISGMALLIFALLQRICLMLSLQLLLVILIFFFFQAEDVIRDLTVTGVQTCALPISLEIVCSARRTPSEAEASETFSREIGRASCRERSVDLGGRRIIKKKTKKQKRKGKRKRKEMRMSVKNLRSV